MNREQRRAHFKKQPRAAKEFAVRIAQQIINWSDGLPEGTKVKLNIRRIMNHPDWSRKTDEYRLFCMSHAKTLMTVKHHKFTYKRPDLVALEEDDSGHEWLFHISELIVQEDKQ